MGFLKDLSTILFHAKSEDTDKNDKPVPLVDCQIRGWRMELDSEYAIHKAAEMFAEEEKEKTDNKLSPLTVK